MRRGIGAVVLLALAGCGSADVDSPGAFRLTETVSGVAYTASFERGVHVEFTPIPDEATGVVVEPFPLFYDGVTVRRGDGQPVTEADRAPAQTLAERFCARGGLVPGQPEGVTFPAMTEWFFGQCFEESSLGNSE